MRVGLLVVGTLLLGSTVGAAAETHPFSVKDMLAMQRISDPQVSSDGEWVVFVLRTTDLEANRGGRDLWLIGSDGEGLHRLTTHAASDVNPRWSPDGRSIFFLSARSGKSQVWRIPIDGGEAQQVTDLPLDVTSLAIARDGTRIAFSMDVFPECDTPECTQAKLDEEAKRRSSGLVYDRLFIRHWDTWKDGRRSHLFVAALDASGVGIETPLDVMRGMDADCPSKPFGGPEEYTFTPDGGELLFAARDAGREEAWSTDFDLYRTSVDGSKAPLCVTEGNPAWDTHPVFSPDGNHLAWMAMQRPGYESDRFRIVIRAWPVGEPRVLTQSWDRSPSGFTWSRDGRTIYANADHLGQRSLFAIDARGGDVRTVVEQGTVRFMEEVGSRLLVAMDHLRSPVELYSVHQDGSDLRQITHINQGVLAAARMGEPEQFTFPGWNGETVYAYVVQPVDFDPERRYPVAFLIHGGPQGSFGNDFHYRWNPQAYAGAGYAVVMVDFHGSVGYGQEFTDSIRRDWGGKPLEDLRKGLAAALERYAWMDGDRVCALGASFGGYMINWIAGSWPDRFRCFVNHDGNLDERMAYYDTEELWFPEWERGGTPWEVPESYSKHNPIDQVGKWRTPMLVVHGALDYRVVDTQGISTFTALQRRGIPSRLLYFPDENHWVLKPHNSIQWHETVIEWIDRWTKGEQQAARE
ncbi:MAG: S9 family peptidase [Candidatus Latescibacterota bacterium]|nr:MAG: S9 family peptidase [Candidatus Latescibacterota bacterium]